MALRPLAGVIAPRSIGELCPKCQKEIPAGARMGLCPPCLFGVCIEALSPAPATAEPASGRWSSRSGGVGRMIAGYRLVRRIAGGSQGEVWEARDLRMGRDVALKMLLGGESPSGSAVHLFQA